MAYTDFSFYQIKYFGDLLTDTTFGGYAERASDWLDTITFKRLVHGFPQDSWNATRIKKCICALADIFYQLDEVQNAMLLTSTEENKEAGGTGVVKSKSAGNESISYVTTSDLSAGAKAVSAIYAAANDKTKINRLLYQTARDYLSGVSDDSGTLLLYAGL